MPSFRSNSLKEEILDMFSKEIGIKSSLRFYNSEDYKVAKRKS